jgi:hypothetical protein
MLFLGCKTPVSMTVNRWHQSRSKISLAISHIVSSFGNEKVARVVSNDSYPPWLSFDTSSASIMSHMAEQSLFE